ncbi:hypothetical protein [Ferrovibrio sp.]|uniref:hypothetical protein n=1 Tax=Ferrovibrio sp. TaxID=1917215 RepID=UPI00311F1FE2
MEKPAQRLFVEKFPEMVSPASERALRQQFVPYYGPTTVEAIGLLRKVHVAYGRGSWPEIDAFLDRVDTSGLQAGIPK